MQTLRKHRTSASSSQPWDTTAQLLQTIAEDRPSPSENVRAPTAATASAFTAHAPTDRNINNFLNLFDSQTQLYALHLCWAHANTMHPQVASWLHACGQWDSAVATKQHSIQTKRRKLCKDHDIPCTRILGSNASLEASMEYIRRQLSDRIQQSVSQGSLCNLCYRAECHFHHMAIPCRSEQVLQMQQPARRRRQW